MERGALDAMKKKRKRKDRISELPQFIIDQIFSNLSTKEAAQTSVLSKTWLQAWFTSPILNLSQYDFSESPKQFFSFVNTTLLRYRTHNLHIHKFEIVLFTVDYPSAYRLLDRSIGTALDHGVKELHISVVYGVQLSPYTLPQTIFSTSAKALTDLKVYQCKFPQNFATNVAICFPFLKTLDLRLACIDDGMLQKLLSSCPSVEKIFFYKVMGFKKFLVSNLDELKILHITSRDDEVIEVDIDYAPSLHFLSYTGSLKLPFHLKVGSAQNLKYLKLYTLIITDNFLNKLITKFPLLEVLNIISCHGLEKINVSGRSLKHLLLKDSKNLVEVNVDAPNLLTFEYKGHKVLSLSLVNIPKELMTCINLTHLDFGWPRITWFRQLRELLKSVNRANVSFYIWCKGVEFSTDLDLIANPLPLENFMPEINQSSSLAAFVETLFSSYHPTIISTQKWHAPDYVDIIKFLGNELIMATRNSNCCSSKQETKCWRHYLKDIKVEVYDNSQKAWQPHPWELLVKSTFLDEQIRFCLKWNANLNAQY